MPSHQDGGLDQCDCGDEFGLIPAAVLKVMATASSRIRTLMSRVLQNPHFDPAGHHVAHRKMILGLLYKAKKKRALALEHLTEARRIFSQFGQTPILARVDAALAELG
jgi:hypothetical protein